MTSRAKAALPVYLEGVVPDERQDFAGRQEFAVAPVDRA
jgi:hypothetical protein